MRHKTGLKTLKKRERRLEKEKMKVESQIQDKSIEKLFRRRKKLGSDVKKRILSAAKARKKAKPKKKAAKKRGKRK